MIVGIQANPRVGTAPLVGSASWRRLKSLGAPETAVLDNLFNLDETVSMQGIEDRVRNKCEEAESRGVATVVFLGRIARLGFSRALRRDVQWFEWSWAGLGNVYACSHPHPSGKSKWWNVPDNVDAATIFWKEGDSWI